MVASKQIVLPFPISGLNEAFAYADQPRATYSALTGNGRGASTVRCQNVIGHEPSTGRNRGGSRPGQVKYGPTQVAGSYPVQAITHVVGVQLTGSIYGEDGFDLLMEDGTTIDLEDVEIPADSARQVTIFGISNGTIAKISTTGTTAVSGGTSAFSAGPVSIYSAQSSNNLFFCDGTAYRYYNADSDTIATWSADPPGELPVDIAGHAGRLIERWRGRLVVSGLANDPTNWFMSEVDNPFGWDYSPVTLNVAMAIAGHNSGAGECGDIITGIVPFSDDTLLFGGDHTIWRMTGDPADGGRLDLVSDIVGMAWGRAWCKSPEGTVYFFGSRGGVYRLDPTGGVPQRLTGTTIDERLADIHTDDNLVSLVWDDRNLGVLVYITPKDGSATTHYFWDVRNQAWWPIVYGNRHQNPLAVHLLDGYDSNDRVVLLGGFDGYVRKIDQDAVNDDGTAIESFVFVGPLSNMMIQEMQATLGTQSGNVDWSIHTSSTLEAAVDANADRSGQFFAGRNRSQWPRARIHQGYLRLASVAGWSLDRLVATVEADTPHRSRIW